MTAPDERRCLAIIVVCAALAYGAALCGGFVYDDHHSVADNAALRSLTNVPAFFRDVSLFSALDNRMYRPVLLTTFAIDHAVGGGAAWVFKLTNLLLHAAAATLLFRLARQWRLRRWPATAAAAAFAVHPLASEAVNMVSGRSELLMVVGVLGGCVLHSAGLRRRQPWSARLGFPIGVGICAAVACGSKATGVVLPGLLLVLEVLHAVRKRQRPQLPDVLWRLVPACAVVVGYLIVRRTVLGAATVSTLRLHSAVDVHTGHGRDLVTQLATMAQELPGVISQLLVPYGLTLDPEVQFAQDPWQLPVLAGAVLLLGLTAHGLAAPRRRPVRLVGTALAWALSAPWILVPLNVPLAEHRFYGLIGGAALVAASHWPRRPARWLRFGIPMVLFGFAAIAAERSYAYRNEYELWRRAHALTPASYRARYSLGVAHMQRGDLLCALVWFQRALSVYPDYVSARQNIAEVELQLKRSGDPEVALQMATWLVQRGGENPFYHLLLSRAQAAVAERRDDPLMFDAAVATALRIHEFAAAKGLVYRTAAAARRRQGDLGAALELLDQSVAAGLDHFSVLLDRAAVLRGLGRDAEAMADLRRAAQQAPFDPRVSAALSAAVPGG